MPFWSRNRDPGPYLPGGEPATPADTPRYVDESRFNGALDEVKALNSKLDQMAGMFTGMMTSGLQGNQQQSMPPSAYEPPIDDISEEEYQQALLQGDAVKVSKRMQAVAERAARQVRHEVEPRFRTIETQGLQIYDQLSGEVGQRALNEMPYYQLFKQDIDQAMQQIPVHQRTQEMRQLIYRSVVGGNIDKVKAHDAAESVRIERDRNAMGAPGRSTPSDGPTPENVFGNDILKSDATWRGGAALWGKRSPDEWAKNYYKVNNLQEASAYSTNIHNLSNCETCFGPIINGRCHCRTQR